MSRSELPVRRHARLALPLYANPNSICSVTVAVRGRQPVFGDPAVATDTVEVLRTHASTTGVTVYAYCVMPDHVHLVLSASPSCDIVKFVGEFKNLAQRAAWIHGVAGSFWQRSFWDHVLRSEEPVRQVVLYVIHNPVRAGLCRSWREWAFAGSLVWTADELDDTA